MEWVYTGAHAVLAMKLPCFQSGGRNSISRLSINPNICFLSMGGGWWHLVRGGGGGEKRVLKEERGYPKNWTVRGAEL